MPQNRQFDLNLLRVFLVVCRRGSFTLAAQELDLTQSSVSNAIARLKAVVGEELFLRVGRGIEPTATAKNLYEQLDGPLLSIEKVILGMESFDPVKTKRQFRVYANDVIISTLQVPLEKMLKAIDIDIIFCEPPSQDIELETALQMEQVDLVIDVNLPHQSSLSRQKVMEDTLVCVAANDHPRIRGQITREQYFKEKHVFMRLRRANLTIADLFTAQALPRRQMHSEQSSLLGLLATIAKSQAIGLSTKSYAQEYAQVLGYQVLEAPIEASPVEIYMVWKSKLTQNPAHMWLRETIVTAIENAELNSSV
ncbi:LysR family transcriptional regulator [uncultured Shewanella sp.]|uniref:LysR family transcriptional regulator n=1 Tax=Shewanella atlantica TaxID=271099 RepID=UPI002634D45A|nr:LysR family transcriptional regulator [uncultured Shewanella sp.]